MNGTVIEQGGVGAAAAQGLDHAEQVVPAPGVEPRGVLAQLVEHLLHLERGGQGLDQAGGPDGPPGDAEVVLRQDEGVVPQPRLEVALHLRQVEVRALPAIDLRLPARGEVEREVHQAARGRLAVHREVLLGQVPAARAHDDRGQLVVGPQLVPLAGR
jgi:hypothetical protein